MSGWRKKRSIMKRYDITASIYDDRYSEEQCSKIEAALANVGINQNDVVLDAGCGTGILFNYIANRANKAVGVDFSRTSLSEAEKRIQAYRNVSLILADVENLPFCSSFTVVFAMTVLQNVPNPERMLRELGRVGTDNCKIAISGLKRIFPKKTFADLLINAGLRVNLLLDEDNLKCFIAVCSIRHR